MLIIFVSKLGPLSVISYFMMKITTETYWNVYAVCNAMEMWIQLDHNDTKAFYSATSSHIKTSARVTALWLSVSVNDLVRKLDIDLLDFCKALKFLDVSFAVIFPRMQSLSNRSCNECSIHHTVILLKSAKFHDTGPCISARSFFSSSALHRCPLLRLRLIFF
jgi:hypothetical protein